MNKTIEFLKTLLTFVVVSVLAISVASCFPTNTPPPVYQQHTYHLVMLDGTEKDVTYAWCTSQANQTGLIVRCYDRDYAWREPLYSAAVLSIMEVQDK